MTSSVEFRTSSLNVIADHAATAYPEESCGILIGGGRQDGTVVVERVRLTGNAAPLPERIRRFEIDPRELIETQRALRETDTEIVGFYHSHPDGSAVPSSTDLPYLRLWPRTVWLIVEVRGGRPRPPRAWWIEHRDGEPAELILQVRNAD